MAVTAEGSALTEAHRLAQVTIQSATVSDLLAIWPLLDGLDLDGSFPGYARAAQAILTLRREQSAGLSAAYYAAFREAEGIVGTIDVPRLAALAEEQALTALLVTGPVTIKQGIARGSDLATARERALVTTAGSMMRLTANAGRETLSAAIHADSTAVGYARVTDGSPCAFCAMLASRGVAFKSGSFAASDPRFEGHGSAKVHDHCGCTVEPVFGDNYQLPGRAAEFEALWAETGAHHSGADAVNAFRRAYERPHIERV